MQYQKLIASCLKIKDDPDRVPLQDAKGAITLDGIIYNVRWGDCAMLNVNIGNRIFTNEQVTLLGEGKYKITLSGINNSISPAQASFLGGVGMSVKPKVKAEIDGVEYEGDEILVDKKRVLIDGIDVTVVQDNNLLVEDMNQQLNM